MKKSLFCLMASLLLCGTVSAQTHFTAPNAYLRSSNTPIVAAVTVDNAAPAAGAELAVFVGDETTPRGLATSEELVDGNFWVQVYYNTDDAETLTFKLWNPTDEGEGAELDTYTLTYGDLDALTTREEGYGTPNDPVELAFTATQTQTTNLAAGWNWWSTPIEANGVESLVMLENSLGEFGYMIKTSDLYTRRKSSGTWSGSLQSIGIDNAIGYKIQATGACEARMTGALANPEAHPITINENWNWIGYPLNVVQSPANALPSDFYPEVNDQIKGQSGYARYKADGTWAPTSFVLTPGNSYLYKSNSSESKTFTFTIGRGDEIQPHQQDNFLWNGNYYVCPDNNSVLAIVLVNGEEQNDSNIEIGAFINGECRGSAKLEYDNYYNRYFAMFTVTGCEGDVIHFGMYNPTTGVVCEKCETNLPFITDDIVGDFEEPFEIKFRTNTEMAKNGNVASFPNPVERNQPFSILIPENDDISEFLIYNTLSTVIRHETGRIKSTSINGISVPGVYMIKVICQSGNVYFNKLIVR